MSRKKTEPPFCKKCEKPSRLTTGAEVFPLRQNIKDNYFYICDGCKEIATCHKGTKRPIGTLAGPELNRARVLLRDKRIDPLWMSAHLCEAYDRRHPHDTKAIKMIQNAAKTRVYAWLAAELGIPEKECRHDSLDLEQCRKAWVLLGKIDYPTIRVWFKINGKEEEAA